MSSEEEHNPRAEWSSRMNFILAATGAAVGLGNIWKFPYMVGDNGGSAFVLLYLFFIVVIGIPIMLAEMLIGKCGRQNPVNSLATMARQEGASRHWQIAGWTGTLALLLVLSFYSVVASWSIAYLIKSFTGAFSFAATDAAHINSIWSAFLANPWRLLLWDSLFMFMTMWVVARGLEQGLEYASRIMMPGLFIILLILLCYGMTTSGFLPSIHFLFTFDASKITADVAISALGHAFFSLAIGVGCMLVFGSYLPSNIRLGSAVLVVTLLDVLVAFLAGIAIFSIIFTYGLSPQGGPGLMFQVLPVAFAHMPGGHIIGSLFFLLLLFAAWTSSISMAEPLVILLEERYHFSRRAAALTVGLVAWVLSIGSLLSFNVWQDFKLFGKWNFFAVITDLVTNILQPLGGLAFALFIGWVVARPISEQGLAFSKPLLFELWLFSIRFLAPIAIVVIIISSLLF